MTIADDVEAEQAAWRLCLKRDAVKETTDLFALGFHSGLAHERARQSERLRALPDDLRERGWAVAVHNDYRLHGEAHTFWLFTNGDRCVKGEGRTDAEALDQIRAALDHPAPIEPEPEPERKGDEVDLDAAELVRFMTVAGYWQKISAIQQRDAAVRAAAIRECVAALKKQIVYEAAIDRTSYTVATVEDSVRRLRALTAPASDEAGE